MLTFSHDFNGELKALTGRLVVYALVEALEQTPLLSLDNRAGLST